jgi:hypothetical protein
MGMAHSQRLERYRKSHVVDEGPRPHPGARRQGHVPARVRRRLRLRHRPGLDLELLPTYDDLAKQRGGIVGSVDIVDCVRQSDSRWFVGDFGFVLRDAQVWPFMPCTGKLGFFEVDPRPVAVVPAWSA